MELMLTEEVAVMVSMLEKAGYEVVVASASGEPITGGTTTLTPDLKLADVKVDDYVGFMFPCLAVDMDLPPPAEAVRIAKEAVAQGKPVAAQNGGVVTLSAAGALNGKQFALLEDPGRACLAASTKAQVWFKTGTSSLLGPVPTWRRWRA